MIEPSMLREMRTRSQTFLKAAEPLAVAAEDGLYADRRDAAVAAAAMPAIESAQDVPWLLHVAEWLMPAVYVHGPAGCTDGDCEDPADDGDAGGDTPEGGEWCPHVVTKVATFADVKRGEYFEAALLEIKRITESASAVIEVPGGLARLVLDQVEDVFTRIAADEDCAPVVAAAPLVGAEDAAIPHSSDAGHGGES